MSSYQTFAYLYDELTQNVEYEKRCDYILSFFEKNGIKSGTVLDLACGTGSMSIPFMKKGYNIIGLDYSEEMLEIASNRLFEAGNNFSLLKAKMQEFELSEKVDACICCLDSINHLNNIDDVQATFKNVYDSLNNNGLFVFDVNTIYKHNEVLADIPLFLMKMIIILFGIMRLLMTEPFVFYLICFFLTEKTTTDSAKNLKKQHILLRNYQLGLKIPVLLILRSMTSYHMTNLKMIAKDYILYVKRCNNGKNC